MQSFLRSFEVKAKKEKKEVKAMKEKKRKERNRFRISFLFSIVEAKPNSSFDRR
jgi:hypothetical protein